MRVRPITGACDEPRYLRIPLRVATTGRADAQTNWRNAADRVVILIPHWKQTKCSYASTVKPRCDARFNLN